MPEFEKTAFQSLSGEMLEKCIWQPQGEVAGVVQLVHGMAEHIARYSGLADALNRASFAVVGHTHMGHGATAQAKGYFGTHKGVETLLTDLDTLRVQTQAQYPGKPYFLLGHSMGSFLVRCYIQNDAQGLAGAILSGTGHYDRGLVNAGLLLSNLLILLGQGKTPSHLLQRISFAGYQSRIVNAKTPFDWLSTDEEQVQKYIDDEQCGFPFTPYGYRDLFRMLKALTDHRALASIPHELPICLLSGTEDPVGGYGAGVGLVASELRRAGLDKVDVRLYKDGRHEMFNERQAKDVYRDLIQWLYNHLA